ncbi:MAG: aminotransferase class V-fold PLP-dependent enzyme [Sandaracinaceae bacterium]
MLEPETLRPHYARFLSADRVLLTGHSHQAWPDVARDAVLEAWDDAAAHVDDKWGHASRAADDVRASVARWIRADADEIALASNTHELLTRFLSAVDLRARPHIVTTRGEFHSMHRQLSRLVEEGLEVSFVDPAPLSSLSERLAAAVTEKTAALMVSTVLFETSSVVPALDTAVKAARAVGAEVLLDAYHAFGVMPLSCGDYGEDVFVTGGGYKYAQWGEGVCFLRVPASSTLRPVYTGWFSDFASLADPRTGGVVRYGPRPADRFAGSTYDPTSHYRARAVSRFFDAHGMDLPALRALSLRQTGRLISRFDALGLEVKSPRDPARRGGFVAIALEDAHAVSTRLRERGVFTDARGAMLRFGPAPYVTDAELDRAVETLEDLL